MINMNHTDTKLGIPCQPHNCAWRNKNKWFSTQIHAHTICFFFFWYLAFYCVWIFFLISTNSNTFWSTHVGARHLKWFCWLESGWMDKWEYSTFFLFLLLLYIKCRHLVQCDWLDFFICHKSLRKKLAKMTINV